MQTLTQSIKSASVNGNIAIERAVKLAEDVDRERSITQELLKKLSSQVGMVLREEIEEHLAGMNGIKFNSTAFNYERLNGDQ